VKHENQIFRKNFSKIPTVLEIPHLLEVQLESYKEFLQENVAHEDRVPKGLHGALSTVFPIEDYNGKASLEYIKYRIDVPKYEESECRLKGYTYVSPLYVTFRLIIWDIPEDTELEKTVRDIKEQEVFFGEVPMMTENGSFIVNGTERVIVNQLHRSPGVFFDQVKSKDNSLGRGSFSARIVPQDGRWLDFEFDSKDMLHVRIDRKKKFHVTVLLKAMGYTPKVIMDYFYSIETIYVSADEYTKAINPETITYQKTTVDIVDKKSGDVLIRKGRRLVKGLLNRLEKAKIKKIPIDETEILEKISAEDIIDSKTGEILINFNETITEETIKIIKENKIKSIKLYYIDNIAVIPSLRNTLLADKTETNENAITDIYKKFRPTDPPTLNIAETFFENMFFNPDTYRLSKVGRIKINYKLGQTLPDDHLTLSKEDILLTIKYLLDLRGGRGVTDDIDHLGNRRVRTVG
jgi:DNA-directed RNA polymerase subunit beta